MVTKKCFLQHFLSTKKFQKKKVFSKIVFHKCFFEHIYFLVKKLFLTTIKTHLTKNVLQKTCFLPKPLHLTFFYKKKILKPITLQFYFDKEKKEKIYISTKKSLKKNLQGIFHKNVVVTKRVIYINIYIQYLKSKCLVLK